jgi:protein-S-isoprenylcysteine O-methyltransferase Ste14
MYVALSLLQVGIGVWMNSAWVVVLVVLAITWITSRVILPEERHLVGKFGQPYLDYQRRVRRWL